MAIALTASTVSDTAEPLVTAQRLWQADIERRVSETSFASSSPFGFDAGEEEHVAAVRRINERPVRGYEIRHLVPLYTLSADAPRAERVRSAILRFMEELPFEIEEERDVSDTVEQLSDFARTMSEWGRPDNYSVVPHAEDPSCKVLAHHNPEAETPRAKEKLAQSEETMSEFQLFLWASKSLETDAIDPALAFSDGVALARKLDRPDLLGNEASDEDKSIRRGAVTAAAAVVIILGDGEDDAGALDWARATIVRAYATPEGGSLWNAGAIIPWHHDLFVARALAMEIRRGADAATVEALLRLTAHPLEQVALAALEQLFGLADAEPRLAWAAMALGFAYCHLPQGYSGDQSLFDPGYGIEAKLAKADEAIRLYRGGAWATLAPPPPAWVPLEPGEVPRRNGNGRRESNWRPPKELWDSFLAPKIIDRVPATIFNAPEVCERLPAFLKVLMDWTMAKLAPPWDPDGADRGGAQEMFDWNRAVPRFIARSADDLGTDAVLSLFLQPVCSLRDDPCFTLLAPFVDTYIRVHVFDPSTVAASAAAILNASLDRVLAARSLKPGRYRAGELYGFDLPGLVESLLFVSADGAMGAARFANRDWSDIAIILPLVDRFVRAAGWVPSVISHFLTLAERTGTAYPVSQLADQLVAVTTALDQAGAKWRGLSIPARIAGLVQRMADSAAPMDAEVAQRFLRVLDVMVDLGDRRAAALQISDVFRDVRVA